MKTETKGKVGSSAVALAFKVLKVFRDEVRSEDRDDFFELCMIVLTSNDDEEVESAEIAIDEILDRTESGIVRFNVAEEGEGDLSKWMSKCGENLRERRKEANITQEQLASMTGIPQSHISRLENGQHSPSFMTLEKIAQALQIPVSILDPSA